MQIIKEVRPIYKGSDGYVRNAICVIRTNCYGSEWSFLSKLVAQAKVDFPGLQDEAIRVVHFGGVQYSGTFGVEFEPPDLVPEDYVKIREVELLR